MSSAFTDRMGAVASPLGFRFNGEAVTREIGGDTGSTAIQTAIVDAEEVQTEHGNGRDEVFDYVMHLDSSDTVAKGDTYLIRGDRVRVARIGKAENGLQAVYCRRVESQRAEARATRTFR